MHHNRFVIYKINVTEIMIYLQFVSNSSYQRLPVFAQFPRSCNQVMCINLLCKLNKLLQFRNTATYLNNRNKCIYFIHIKCKEVSTRAIR